METTENENGPGPDGSVADAVINQQAQQAVDTAAQEQKPDADYESRAKMMGWKPEDQWLGDRSGWVDAKTYVTNAEKRLDINNSQLRKYEQKFMELEARDRQREEEFRRLMETNRRFEERAVERAKQELRAKQDEAVANGDLERVRRLRDEEDKLSRESQAAQQQTYAEDYSWQRQFGEWKTKNDWYQKDQAMTKYADTLSDAIVLKSQNLPPAQRMSREQILNYVETEVKSVFEHKFRNPNRDMATTVNSTGYRTGSSGNGQKGYSSLPAHAKQACDYLISKGAMRGKTQQECREEYAKEYYQEEEETAALVRAKLEGR